MFFVRQSKSDGLIESVSQLSRSTLIHDEWRKRKRADLQRQRQRRPQPQHYSRPQANELEDLQEANISININGQAPNGHRHVNNKPRRRAHTFTDLNWASCLPLEACTSGEQQGSPASYTARAYNSNQRKCRASKATLPIMLNHRRRPKLMARNLVCCYNYQYLAIVLLALLSNCGHLSYCQQQQQQQRADKLPASLLNVESGHNLDRLAQFDWQSETEVGPSRQQIDNVNFDDHEPSSSSSSFDERPSKSRYLENVHRLMSEQDLRRTFQVDSHDQVPEYEILSIKTTSTRTRTSHSNARHKRSPKDDNTTSEKQKQQQQQQQAHQDGDKLIVMKLTTFGKDYKLRLRRNIDFQQRIHDMKMFMAESTQDGQLRYTEVKNQQANNNNNKKEQQRKPKQQQQHQHQHQQDHNWDVGSTYHDEENLAALLIDQDTKTGHFRVDGTIGNDFVIKPMPQSAIDALQSYQKQRQQEQQQQQQLAKQQQQQQQQQGQQEQASNNSNNSNNKQAASSESNLDAEIPPNSRQDQGGKKASLVEPAKPDADLAQLQSAAEASSIQRINLNDKQDNGIKLIPREQEQQQQQQQFSASTSASSSAADEAARDVSKSSKRLKQPASKLEQSNKLANDTSRWLQPPTGSGSSSQSSSASLVSHSMHQDDPHDDDEMFLDEDEAIELQSHHSNSNSNANSNSNPSAASSVSRSSATAPSDLKQASRSNAHTSPSLPINKTASERKWRKYKKLLAQTKVPKLGDLSQTSNQQPQTRAKRDAEPEVDAAADDDEIQQASVQMLHHIVFRQRPSAEESSSEHQGSMLMNPRSMDSLVGRLQSARDAVDATEWSHDPLGGQFYLEPAIAGLGDKDHWTLWSQSLQNSTRNHAHSQQSSNNQTVRQPVSSRFKRNALGTSKARVPSQPSQASPTRARTKRQAPDTVWPEVLLVVDYDSYLLHNGDSRDVKRYFVSFWNGVDLRYKLLVHPHIRISLAGMIVAKDRDATPYLERNRLRAPNADAVDAAGALTDMGKYLYREDRLPTYDLAVVITKLDMCRRRYEGGRCNRGTAGFAYVGGACVVNKRLEKVNSVAIIEDSGGFSGIIVAAHEVGHLLGCVHDGSPPPSYLGGPGATHCPWEDGFIMSDLRHTERGFRWSHCSVEQFKHFLHGETATCLYNYPHESQMLHRLLPGTMLSLDEQCKRDRGTNACFKDARVCAQLFCFDSASGYCVSYRPAAEGSPCGEGQICRNGKCVGEIENIIPDYSHQSQTVVARRGQASGALGSASSAPVPALARLADNGLSASSTSAATSSPPALTPADVKSLVSTGSALLAPSNNQNKLTSRMDTSLAMEPVGNLDDQSPSISAYGSKSFGDARQPVTPRASQQSNRMLEFSQRSGQQAQPTKGAKQPNLATSRSSAHQPQPQSHKVQHQPQKHPHFINGHNNGQAFNYLSTPGHASMYSSASQTVLNYQPTSVGSINNNNNSYSNLLKSVSPSSNSTIATKASTSSSTATMLAASAKPKHQHHHQSSQIQSSMYSNQPNRLTNININNNHNNNNQQLVSTTGSQYNHQRRTTRSSADGSNGSSSIRNRLINNNNNYYDDDINSRIVNPFVNDLETTINQADKFHRSHPPQALITTLA